MSKVKTLITVAGIFIFILLIIFPIGISILVGKNKSDRANREVSRDQFDHPSNTSTTRPSAADHQISQVKLKDNLRHTVDASSKQTMTYPSNFPIPQLPGSLVTKIDSEENKVVLERNNSDFDKTTSFYRDWFKSNGWSVRKDVIPAGFTLRIQLEYEKDGQIFSVEVKSETGKDTVELRIHK